jgi:dihydropteroate synthase
MREARHPGGDVDTAIWRCGRFALTLTRPLVMGILNITPDSFSDGGRFADAEGAIAAGRAMIAGGADILDVGGESTRPGAAHVTTAEELERVLPVVAALAEDGRVPVSIDTRHAVVASACVAAGAAILNDVSGFRDPAMVALVAGCEAGCVVMHMCGEPGTMQNAPSYDDVVAEVGAYLAAQAALLAAAGVARDRIAIDPGIGFGKTTDHNLELLTHLPDLAALGYPVVVGASRKRFIGELTGVAEPDERLAGSLAVAVWAVTHGADVVRVHDVEETVRAFRMLNAMKEGAK